MSERLFARRLPVETIQKAINIVKKANESYIGLDPRRQALEVYRYDHMREKLIKEEGEKGLQRIAQEEASIANTVDQIAQEATEGVKECIAEYDALMRSMFDISPSHMGGDYEKVFKLLESGIIDDESELQRIIIDHKENNTFVRVAIKYAERKNWTRTVITNVTEERLKSVSRIFDLILEGAMNPGGYYAMLCAYPTTFHDFVKSYDLIPEYAEALGKSVEDTKNLM